MKDSVPLNDEQRRFATDNHNLVFSFLNEKGLPEDDYYDVVIFGYLQAVKDYFTHQELSRYSFSTLAWKRMNRHFSNHMKSLSNPKHCAQLVSLYAPADGSSLTWEETLADVDSRMEGLETALLLHDLAVKLPCWQMSVVRMKADGYGIREIARRQKTTMRTVRSLLDDAYDMVVAVCGR